MNERNNVFLRGTVVSINASSKVSTIRLVCDSRNGRKNFPRVYIFDSKMLKSIGLRDYVYITGHTQNRRVYHPSTWKSSSQSVIVADSVSISGRALLDFIMPEEIDNYIGAKPEDLNNILVIGTVLSKYQPNDNYVIVKVKAQNQNGKASQCDFVCTRRQAEFAKSLNAGDNVAVLGYAYTSIKDKPDGKKIFYENIFCKDIAKAV